MSFVLQILGDRSGSLLFMLVDWVNLSEEDKAIQHMWIADKHTGT